MSAFAPLPPLDAEGVLWVAAIELVPIEDRTEWVKTMLARVEQINAARADGSAVTRPTLAPDPVPVMLKVAGKRFVCKCGANVFTKAGDEYRCNGCSRVYG